jgi:nucleoside-diphosphate-sugar epimerase
VETISILGCGWLGKPLAVSLIRDAYEVLGSTTSKDKESELRSLGVKPFTLKFNPSLQGEERNFFHADILVVSIPPRSKQNNGTFFLEQIKALIEEIEKASVRKIIFISSTSVYPDTNQVVSEGDADPESILAKAESAFVKSSKLSTTVIRFAGLVGPGRHPGKFLSGKTIGGADNPVNIIHQSDCIRIIKRIIESNTWNKIFNACADLHPAKEVFYTMVCKQSGLPPPVFSDKEGAYKNVSSEYLKNELTFKFDFPDPMTMTY